VFKSIYRRAKGNASREKKNKGKLNSRGGMTGAIASPSNILEEKKDGKGLRGGNILTGGKSAASVLLDFRIVELEEAEKRRCSMPKRTCFGCGLDHTHQVYQTGGKRGERWGKGANCLSGKSLSGWLF